LARIGVEPRGTTPQEADAFMHEQHELWKQVIMEGNIKPE
jgi:hypothetical protein